MDFFDVIFEGDGERFIRCWKFFLFYFKEEKLIIKYVLEVFYLFL